MQDEILTHKVLTELQDAQLADRRASQQKEKEEEELVRIEKLKTKDESIYYTQLEAFEQKMERRKIEQEAVKAKMLEN